jgi:hypothetical protein
MKTNHLATLRVHHQSDGNCVDDEVDEKPLQDFLFRSGHSVFENWKCTQVSKFAAAIARRQQHAVQGDLM